MRPTTSAPSAAVAAQPYQYIAGLIGSRVVDLLVREGWQGLNLFRTVRMQRFREAIQVLWADANNAE